MKKTVIKMKNYAGNVNIVNNNNLSIKILHLTIFSIGILAICYVFLLGSMVFNIVERQSLSMQSKALSNEVGDLELKYLSMSGKIDRAMSQKMGFKETKVEYASRKSLTALRLTANEL